jgi:FKBP-type peptidyl-prolyl cis-trans isomerase
VIPPALAYGNMRFGPIPANSTLLFEVVLNQVQ